MRIATLFGNVVLTALLAAPAVGHAAACDVDGDGDIDRDDLSAIIAARNTPASGPDDARDGNGDGVINVLDARFCVLRCTLPGCASPSTNTAPVASAGTDQTAFVLDTVTLDGSASSDADGDALSFAWSLLSAPFGSLAALDDPTAVMPSFQLDAAGTFVVQLIVNDGALDSAADTITVSTLNSAPVADAGPDRTAFVLDSVTLDGGGSSDVDGDALSYLWILASVPPGSAAMLDDTSAVTPSFVVDSPGDYVVELVVNDGIVDSLADTVVVSTLNSPPVSDAGPDQTALVLDIVSLDGSGSTDVDGDALSFSWSLLSRPPGSGAVLDDPAAVMPMFQIDRAGTYVAQLVVNDGSVDSIPDTVVVSTTNSAPTADAGVDQSVFVTDLVFLDGSGSSDPDLDPLSFAWSLASVPFGSSSVLDDPSSPTPSFVVDMPGDYIAQLIVNDGLADSVPDTTTISTNNVPPVADAGVDQAVHQGVTVLLDGLGSFDPNFDPLTFSWSFTAVPGGSAPLFDDPTSPTPSFDADLAGAYIAQLIVNDGFVDSAPDSVVITSQNIAPVANAGPDQTVPHGTTVFLDGTLSLDPDSDPLTFSWMLTAPGGSTAALSDPTSPTPSFVADLPGSYTVDLVVNDGFVDSASDSVVITSQNIAPVANAGPDQTVPHGTTVFLDGTLSLDPDSDPLTFSWMLTAPGGSTAALSDPTSPTPSFVADLPGSYTVDLVVNDGFVDSASDSVVITSQNIAPVANAGPDQTVPHGTTVFLDGTLSLDPDSDPLTFSWMLTAPGGSTAVLSDTTSPTPSFVADLPGSYTVDLVVNDGFTDSAPDSVVITSQNIAPVANAGPDQTVPPGGTVILDGTLSLDPDSDPLTFSWTLTAPGGSTAVLSDTTSPTPSFVADLPGSYTVDLVVNDGFVDSAPDSVTVTTSALPAFAIDDPAVVETNAGTTSLVFTITLPAPATVPASVDVATTDGTATAGSDYTALPLRTINFGIGDSSQTVSVTIHGDQTVELDETVILQLSNPTGAQVTDPVGDGTISNDDTASLSIDDVLLAEGDAGSVDFVFTVTLDNAVDTGVTVDFTTVDGSALAGSDYVAAAGTLNFAGTAGETQTVTVPVNGDTTVELDETANVQLSNVLAAGRAVSLGDGIGDLGISNDDAASLSIDDVLLAEGDAGSVDFVFTVTLDNAVDTGVTVDFTTVDGSALAGSDYVAAAGTLNFAGTAGETQTVTVPVNGDTTVELDETANVQLSNVLAAGRAVSLGDGIGDLGISNDDAASLSIDDVLLAEGDAGSVDFVFTVTLDNAVDTGVTVDFTTVNGSALVGSDYAATAGTLNFLGTAGETQTVTVPVNGDTTVELDETANVQLSNVLAAGRDVTLGDDIGDLGISNDDAASLSIDDVLLAEGDAGSVDFVFTVTLDNAVDTGVTVDFTSVDGSALAGSDYAATAGTLNFLGTAGETQTVTVPVNGDTTVELDETANVQLSNVLAAGRDVTLGDDIGDLGISNDDAASLSIDDVSMAEGDAGSVDFVFTVTLDNVVDTGVTVDFTSVDGSALAGSDYAATAGTLNFLGTAGETQTVTVPVNGDTDVEPDEDFFVDLSALQASGRDVTFADAQGAGSVLNDDVALASITLTPPTLALATLDPGSLTVTLSAPAGVGGQTVAVAATPPGIITVPAFVVVPESATSISLPVAAGTTGGSATVTASASGHSDGSATVAVTARDMGISTAVTLIGVTRTVSGTVTLALPAPAGGVSVTVTSLNEMGTATIAPGLVFIAAGATQGVFDVTGVAGGNTTIQASAPGYGIASTIVTITDSVVNLPQTLAVPLGQVNQLPIGIAPGVAPVGGVTVNLSSSNPTIASLPASVFIPAGEFLASVDVDGNVPGTVTVTGDATGYAIDTTVVTVSAEFNIIEVSTTATPTFPATVTVRLESSGTPTSAPSDITVNLVSSDPTCVAPVTPAMIGAGLVTTPATLNYGGSASLPCSAVVTAQDSGVIVSDTVNVTVNPDPPINIFTVATTVGAGLQTSNINGNLGLAAHGGVTLRITSSDPSTVLVAPNASTAGAAFIDISQADGDATFAFYVQGVEGATGTATVTASAPGFQDDTLAVTVVQPSFDVRSLQTSIDTLDPDDAFFVRTGIPNAGGTALVSEQAARAGGGGLSVTVTVTDDIIAELVTTTTAGNTATLGIPEGLARTPASVATGGVALSPLTAGTIDVSASIPGFGLVSTSTRTVTVTAPTMSFTGTTRNVGAGLQSGPVGGTLSASQHGGVTIRIISDDPTRVLVAPNASTPGTASVDRTVANGSVNFSFFVQGLESTTGTATLTLSMVSGATFSPLNTMTVDVLQPSFDLNGVQTSIDTLDPDDAFFVRTGIPNAGGTALVSEQAARAGGGGLSVTVTVTDDAVAELVTTTTSGDTATLGIPEGLARTPSSVAAGGVALSPLTAGTIDVSASIPGFGLVNTSTRTVTVTAPTMSFTGTTRNVGAGLQSGPVGGTLSASQHGGVTIRITSDDPTRVLVAPNASTPGTASVDRTVANGAVNFSFFVQGLEGTTGTATLTLSMVSGATFLPLNTMTVDVLQPSFDLNGVQTSIDTLDPDDAFFVRTGIPNSSGTAIVNEQAARTGGGGLSVTVTVTDDAIAELVTTTTSGDTATLGIPEGLARTPSSVAAGGVALSPLTAGTIDVSASIPGFGLVNTSTRTVTVTTPSVSLSNISGNPVGAGLQDGFFTATLSASQHGGTTVRIASSNVAVVLVAPNGSTAGTSFIDVPLANGQTLARFFIQGVPGAGGNTALITATASGFLSDTTTVDVVQPAMRINGLGTSPGAGAGDDAFTVSVGRANSGSVNLIEVEQVRAGGGALTVTVTNSNAVAGQLVTTASTGQSVTVDIAEGSATSSTSVATGGVAFDPLAVGQTLVGASAPGFISTDAANVIVNVGP